MKIKEVSKLTGLTEKTIRFYEDKGLITPVKEEINGRIFRSYLDEDVKCLNMVADLRRLDFSISDISGMRDNPEKIPDILKEYFSRTSDELEFKTDILKRFEQLKYEDVTSLEYLDQLLKEISANRPLPVSDTEFEFYKIDGITKEELQGEVLKYQERLSAKFKKKVRNTILLFSAVITTFIILAGFIWRTTFYLVYVPSWHFDLKWRIMLIPFDILLFCGLVFVFIKVMKFITAMDDEDRVYTALRICRYSILILLLSFAVGIFVSANSLKSMERMKSEIGEVVTRNWYSIYNMARYVDMYLARGDEDNGIRYGLYVNQACYNYGYGDYLRTRMYDLLVLSYDPAFQELISTQTGKEEKEKLKQMLKEINSEIKDIGNFILEKQHDRADLVRYDITEAVELRKRINDFADKYNKKADDIFRQINAERDKQTTEDMPSEGGIPR